MRSRFAEANSAFSGAALPLWAKTVCTPVHTGTNIKIAKKKQFFIDHLPFPLYLGNASFGRAELFDLVQFITQFFIGAIAKKSIGETFAYDALENTRQT
jgi:hypothetical protein